MRRGFVGLLAVVLWLAVAGAAVGAGVDFVPSTYNPGVGEPVTFEVCQACLGSSQFRFSWEFDESGVGDTSTTDLSVTHSFSQAGQTRVKLTARDSSGRTFSCTKQIIVGEPLSLVAVRDVSLEDNGTILVRITLTAVDAFSELGVEETVPRGWQPQEVDRGNALLVWLDIRPIAVIWSGTKEIGPEATYSYRLVAVSSATGLPELSGVATGYLVSVPTGDPSKRVKVTVCGDVTIPDY